MEPHHPPEENCPRDGPRAEEAAADGGRNDHGHGNGNNHQNNGHATNNTTDQDHARRQPHNPRELHTAESVMEYMHELEEEKKAPKYKDYLKAQKHLKQARGRRRFTLHGAKEEEPRHFNNKHRHKSMRAMSALSSRQGGGGSSTFSQQEWQAFLDQPFSQDEEEEKDEEGGPDQRFSSIKEQNEEEAEDTNNEQEEDDDDDDQSYHGHSLTVPWYCRPVQRQRWDDDQVLPHINWGDLFFDLFYVAAAYNLGAVLISALGSPGQTGRGIVYFVGIFGPLYNIWENDVVYSSRYTLVDYAHRIVAVIRFLCVSFAVLSIKPIYALGDKTSVETFCLTLSFCCESIMQLGLNLELYFYGEGDRQAIRNHTKRKIVYQFIPASLTYMAAAIIAGVSFFQNHDTQEDGYGYEGKEDAYGYEGKEGYGDHTYDNSTDDHYGEETAKDHAEEGGHFLFRLLAAAAAPSGCEEDDGHRALAGGGYEDDCASSEDTQWTIADVPLILCLSIYILNIVHNLFRKYSIANAEEGGKDIRQYYVPSNIDYMIHRYGEWIMLMIGESILSLLIVETIEASEYYAVAGLGCLTVIVLQLLKFESEPSHADGHALYKSMLAATLFSLLIQILSMGLIAFGVSYKIMLTNVFQDEVDGGGDSGHRLLAAVPVIEDKVVASLFCGALSIVLLSLEMMLGTHKGVTQSYHLLFHEVESFHIFAINWPLFSISLFKLGLISFTATLSQWATEPTLVTIMGFLIVTAMAITRIVGWGFVHHEEEIRGALSFVADQTTNLGRNIVQATDSVARTTGSMAKKTLIATTSLGLESGRNIVQATDSAARTTGSMAKKTLIATTSLGLESLGMDRSERTVDRPPKKLEFNDEHAMDRALWDTSFDGVVVTDRVGVIKYVNGVVLKQFGYESEKELLGNNVSVLVGGHEAQYHHMYMQRFNKNESTSTTLGKQRELKAKRKDGNEFSCLIGIREIPHSAMLIGYIRPAAELAVPEKDAFQVDDTSFDSIIVIDPKGTILDVNLTTLSEFGFVSKEELVGNNISMLVGGGEAEYHDMHLSKFNAERKETSTIGNQRVLHAKRKDGKEFPCVIGITRAPGGDKLIGYIRNMTGITPEDIALKEKTKYMVDDTSFDSIIVTDAEGIMLQVNATAVEEFGYNAKAELVGHNITMLVGGGHAKNHGKYMKRFQKKGQEDSAIGKQRTLKARRKNGSEFKCVIGIKSIPDTDCLIGYIRSTEGLSRKEAAAEYDSVSQISTRTGLSGASVGTATQSGGNKSVGSDGDILDEAFDAIIVADVQGVIKRVNQTVLDLFRYESKDELVGQNISMLVGGGDAKMHDTYLEKFQRQGKSASQIGKQRVLYSKRKDGTEFPCIVGIKRTPKNDGLVGWIRDMSEIKEEELRSSIQITNMKLLDPVERLIDDKSFDAIIVIDLKGVIKRVNKTAVREFRYDSKDELIGRNVSDLVGGKVSARKHDKFLERFQKAGKSSSTIGKQRILKSKRKDGSEFQCIIGINRVEETEDDLLVGYIRNLDMTYEANESEQSSDAASTSLADAMSAISEN